MGFCNGLLEEVTATTESLISFKMRLSQFILFICTKIA